MQDEIRAAHRTGSMAMERVVTAVDFHEGSRDAALWAMRHLAPAAEHALLHVIEQRALPGPLLSLGGDREERRLAARDRAMQRLGELAEQGTPARSIAHVREGSPAEEVVQLAVEERADLVVVGEQGVARGVGALLGSTAERVLHASRVPVLVARKVSDRPPRSLLAAIDPSEVADVVLGWVGDFLDRHDASVTVLNVVDPLLLMDELSGMPAADALQGLEEEATSAMRRWLDEMVEGAGLPLSRVERKVLVGDPSYEIISGAARQGADLVLIGSKGGDIARTPMIGRIVNRVVRSAPCSVLVTMPRTRAPG